MTDTTTTTAPARTVAVRTRSGATGAETVALAGAVFGLTPNVALMHQVVTAQLANRRAGTQSTLTRAEVSGGGKKPWKQKGTGRARQGSSRAPHWVGGGVAHGPKPRSYAQRTPKKMVQLALRSALSDRAALERVAVVEAWDFDAPRTKDARLALEALGLFGKVLVVLGRDDAVAAKSFRNLPRVQLCLADQLNAYDVLRNDWVVFTRATLPTGAAAERDVVGEDAPPAPLDEPVLPGPEQMPGDPGVPPGEVAVPGTGAPVIPPGEEDL